MFDRIAQKLRYAAIPREILEKREIERNIEHNKRVFEEHNNRTHTNFRAKNIPIKGSLQATADIKVIVEFPPLKEIKEWANISDDNPYVRNLTINIEIENFYFNGKEVVMTDAIKKDCYDYLEKLFSRDPNLGAVEKKVWDVMGGPKNPNA
jgi:hypothetical protein